MQPISWKTLVRDVRWLAVAALAVALTMCAYMQAAPVRWDLGRPAAGMEVEGWFATEQGPSGVFRWTTSPATVRLSAVTAAFQPARVRIVLSAPRPEGMASPVPVEAWINGRLMQRWQVGAGPEEHVIDVDASLSGWSGNLVLTLRAPTFTPPSDLRALSLLVTALEIEPQGAGLHWPPLIVTGLAAWASVWVYGSARRLGSRSVAALLLATVVTAGLGVLFVTARPLAAGLLARLVLWTAATLLLAEMSLLRRGQPTRLRSLRLATALFGAAFGLRLLVAHTPGDHDNFVAFKMMIENIARHGVGRAYDLDPVVGAYPPLHQYLMAVAGTIYRLLASPELDMTSPRLELAMKLPTILLDSMILLVIVRYAQAHTTPHRAWAIAAAYAFNPGIVYVTAFHGQLGDPLYTLGLLVGVVGILAGQGGVAGVGSAAGLLTKPQAAAWGPFLVAAGLRHLPSRRELGKALAAGLATAGVILLPFILAGTLRDMLHTVSTTIGHGPRISSLAFNVWWLVGWGRVWSIHDTEVLAAGLTYRTVALVLYFGLAQGLIVWRAWTARSPSDLALLAAFAGLAFFMLPTQIHENYLFPTFALLAIAAVHNRRATILTAILAATWGVNLLTYDTRLLGPLAPQSPEQISPLFPLQLAATLVNVVVFVWWTLWTVRGGRVRQA